RRGAVVRRSSRSSLAAGRRRGDRRRLARRSRCLRPARAVGPASDVARPRRPGGRGGGCHSRIGQRTEQRKGNPM
ncbi:uncharacterized protein METZ01_LOCUS434427, partial [marine metagenome]